MTTANTACDTHSVYSYDSGSMLEGAPTVELVSESESEGPTGASRPSNGRYSVADPRVLEVLETREKIDATKARPILVEEFGAAAADEAIEVKESFTKAALKKLVRARAVTTKEKLGEGEEAVLQRIRAADGVSTSSFTTVKAVKPARLKAG